MKKKNFRNLLLFIILFFSLRTGHTQDIWYRHNIAPSYPLPLLNSVNWKSMSTFYGFTVGNSGFIAFWTAPLSKLWFGFGTNITTKNLNSVFVIDSLGETKAYIAGDSGCVIKMNDYPFEYKIINSNTTKNLYSTFFFNYLSGIVVGDSGTVIKTTDGGKNWSSIPAVTQNRLYSVHFPSLNNGYAVGNNGIVIKTTDNGNNWAIKTSPVADSLRCVWFTDDNTGFVVSKYGNIFKTTNGGNSWQLKPSGTTENLNAVCFYNATIGYVAGNNKLVLKSTNAGDTWQIQNLPQMQDGNFKGIGINGEGGVNVVGTNGLAIGNYPEPPGLIRESTGMNILSLSPNPASNYITMNLQTSSAYNLQIFNLHGQLILQQSLTQNNNQIDISQLPSGVYIAKIKLSDGSFVQEKFVVIK